MTQSCKILAEIRRLLELSGREAEIQRLLGKLRDLGAGQEGARIAKKVRVSPSSPDPADQAKFLAALQKAVASKEGREARKKVALVKQIEDLEKRIYAAGGPDVAKDLGMEDDPAAWSLFATRFYLDRLRTVWRELARSRNH